MSRKYPYQNLSLKNMKGEVWEDIPGLDGFYLISNLGRIKSLRRYILRCNAMKGYWTKDRILAQTVLHNNPNQHTGQPAKHLQIIIRYENKMYPFGVARLVYCIFVQEINMDNVEVFIKYKDGDALNCRSSNLIKATFSEHRKICYEKGQVIPSYYLDPSKFKNLLASRKPVRWVCQYNNKGKLLKTYESQRIASSETGIGNPTINAALKRKIKTAGGYIWRYKGESPGDIKNILKRAAYNGRNKTVTQYDAKGKRVHIYNSVKAAEQATGANQSQILRSTRSEYLSAKGFFWRAGEGKATINVSAYWDRLSKNKKRKSYKVGQYDLKGRKIREYESLKEAMRKTGVYDSTIRRATIKKLKIAGGFFWRIKKYT